jgi:hypothetical protein
MQLSEQQRIREKTASLMLDWAAEQRPSFTGESKDGFADAILAAHLVADESGLVLRQWIEAARRSGLSWSEIGDALGITKQAAQQRFKSPSLETDLEIHEGEEIVRLGATAFNEMSMLRAEGLKGNELIRTGPLILVFRPSPHNWEYCRRVGAVSKSAMKKAGWSYASSWLPFTYFKRPIAD